MVTYTKESLIEDLKTIRSQGWIKSTRPPGNSGAVGHTLEDLLGIEENNLPIPNAAEWELKTQRINKIEHFHYQDIFVLQKFSPDKFIEAIAKGLILVDFDARTRHNHGTKFRMRKNALPDLYENVANV